MKPTLDSSGTRKPIEQQCQEAAKNLAVKSGVNVAKIEPQNN